MARKKSRQKPKPSTETTTRSQPVEMQAQASAAPAANGATTATLEVENGVHQSTSQAIQDSAKLTHPDPREAIQEGNGISLPTETAISAGLPRDSAALATKSKAEPEPEWVKYWKKTSNILGSLQMAVLLLSIFALVVFLGTLMEHWYNTKIAQELVYKSWWFNFLLFMLTVTIFFAAAKKMKLNKEPLQLAPITATTFLGKVRGMTDHLWATIAHFWPWKRHQFGFIVTHIGLITMLTGGLLNNWFGVDAYVQLLDSQDAAVLAQVNKKYRGTIPKSADYCVYSDIAEIRVTEMTSAAHGFHGHHGMASPKAGKVFAQDFWGGAFPWKTRPVKGEQKTDWLLAVMNFLHNPLGQSWSMPVGDTARLEVLDFIPLGQRLPFAKDESGYAAFQFQLRSDKFPEPMDAEWMSFNPQDSDHRVSGFGPTLIECLGEVRIPLIQEFLKPPSPAELGTKGVLAIHVGGKIHRLSVADFLETKKALGSSDWSIQINKYLHLDPKAEADDEVSGLVQHGGPGLEVKLWGPDGEAKNLLIFSRMPGIVWDKSKDGIFNEGQGGNPSFFFHMPDLDRGQDEIRGVLQFVKGTDGNLYYRSFTSKDDDGGYGKPGAKKEKKSGELSLEKSGMVEVTSEKTYPIWQKMGWSFNVLEYYPHAKRIDEYEPVNIAPGKDTQRDKDRYPSVVLCRLTAGKDKRDFWMQKGQIYRNMKVGDKLFTVSYSYKEHPLGFTIDLERAEKTVDPGTGVPASFSSFVRIFDAKKSPLGEEFLITMNQPLEYRSYTFYQSNHEFTGIWDGKGRPVSLSGFSVGRDPGIALKYAGSIMLALGISIMFYMKAYFFKPMRRKTTTTPSAQ